MDNPWIHLPKSAPFILPSDLLVLNKHNLLGGTSEIRAEVLPVPFLGSLDSAKIVLLNLNPGFVDQDIEIFNTDDQYVEENRKTLTFESNPPFFYLNEAFSYTAGFKWWSNRLKQLTNAVGKEVVSLKVMCVEFFPYHSRTFSLFKELLPSQVYSFYLVKEAIKQEKTIVIMRSKKLWLSHVPELENYSYMELKTPRSPYVSRNNLDSGNFEKLINLLQE